MEREIYEASGRFMRRPHLLAPCGFLSPRPIPARLVPNGGNSENSPDARNRTGKADSRSMGLAIHGRPGAIQLDKCSTTG
jgi:hypothetical protein